MSEKRRERPRPAPPPGAQEGPRHRRASPPGRVPLEQAHRRPGDRRHAPAARWPPPRPSRPTCVRPATGNVDAATRSARCVAERAKAAGVAKVVFDRGGFLYHGRVAAVADAAREAGLEF